MLRLLSRCSKFVLNVARKSPSSFPEEPLNLSPLEGGGYYPATINEKLKGNKYKIVGKVGYGPRSSTWLVSTADNLARYAVKIFTIAASERANTVELPIYEEVNKLTSRWTRFLYLPTLYNSFWVESSAGSHLCILTDEFSTSIRDLQRSADNQRLPIHAVQRIAWNVANSLKGLHNVKIMHGGIKAENIVFEKPLHFGDPQPKPAPTTLKIGNHTTVLSQPPPEHGFTWNDSPEIVFWWPLYLNNLGHAQRLHYKPEETGDYSSAPETLLQRASCSPLTDIWMLGCMTYNLLTGKTLFHSSNSTSKQIAVMRATLRDSVPEEWLNDNKMKDYNAEDHESAISIEAGLSDVLDKEEAREASAFIKGCLRLDPRKRLRAGACKNHDWLRDAGAHASMLMTSYCIESATGHETVWD